MLQVPCALIVDQKKVDTQTMFGEDERQFNEYDKSLTMICQRCKQVMVVQFDTVAQPTPTDPQPNTAAATNKRKRSKSLLPSELFRKISGMPDPQVEQAFFFKLVEYASVKGSIDAPICPDCADLICTPLEELLEEKQQEVKQYELVQTQLEGETIHLVAANEVMKYMLAILFFC